MIVKDNALMTNEGEHLKSLGCPFKYKELSLQQRAGTLECENCKKTIINTDFFTEEQVIKFIKQDGEVCLLINKCNPMFKIEAT